MQAANIRFVRATLAVLVLAGASLAAADVVVLTNGRVFEDVVATRSGDTVEIELAFGSMRVSASEVEAIRDSQGPLERYLAERERLRSDAGATATEWMDLAIWARRHGIGHGFRECALVAADLDPTLDTVAAAMRTLDYVLEPELGQWIPFEVQMERRGFVRDGNGWISPETQAARAEAARQEAETLAQRQRDRLTDAVLALAVARVTEPPPPQVVGYPVLLPGVVGPYFYHRPGQPVHPAHHGAAVDVRVHGGGVHFGGSIAGIHRGRLPGSTLPPPSQTLGSFKLKASGATARAHGHK